MIWLHIGAGSVKDFEKEIGEGLRIISKNVNNYEDIYITHIRNGIHGESSLHPFGNAFDMRKLKYFAASKLKKWLGDNYDVIDENTHLHVEYDPK